MSCSGQRQRAGIWRQEALGKAGEGLNDLVPAALAGIRKMPAKGGKPELSDGEVAAAVIYMANAGGGKFAEPSADDLARWRQKADRRIKK